MKNLPRAKLHIFNLLLAVCLGLIVLAEAHLLNHFPGSKLALSLRPGDILIGLTIYLKTSVDFAILIGLLMSKYDGRRHGFMIIGGTALGNALGTIIVMAIWFFFKEVTWLLAIMIILASLVLLKLAETSLEHIDPKDPDEDNVKPWQLSAKRAIESFLGPINRALKPLLSRVVPDMQLGVLSSLSLSALFILSLKVPFILGLDDFAGYVPLFNVVNVVGFAIGVIVGHAILCSLLFASPRHTARAVKNPTISLIGSVAFLGLSGWGLIEATRLLLGHH